MYCYPIYTHIYSTIYVDASGSSEVLEPETKAVVSASGEVKLDTYTDASKEVQEILEAKGTYVCIM